MEHSDLDDTAVVFVAPERPEIAQGFVLSVRARCPGLAIHVAERSERRDAMESFYRSHRVDVLWMPEGAGGGASRNALVERTTNDYVCVCDGAGTFTPSTDLPGARQILEQDPEVGIVGGRSVEEPGELPERITHAASFLHLDERNRELTRIPAYYFLPLVRHVGTRKYFLCDAVQSFALFRRAVFDDPRVRWDPRFHRDGLEEDFYLNLKLVSSYRVAYYPALACLQRGAPEEYASDAGGEDWRRFLEKWGIEQYSELDEGPRTAREPGKVHARRTWRHFLSEGDITTKTEWGIETYPVSLTDDRKVILATHFDPDSGAPIRFPEPTSLLTVDGTGALSLSGGTPELAAPLPRAAELERLRLARSKVGLRFEVPFDVTVSEDLLLHVQVSNHTDHALEVGPDAVVPGRFGYRFRRGDALAEIHDGANPCFADIPVGTHEQVVEVRAPAIAGLYELDVFLVAGDVVLGPLATASLVVHAGRPRQRAGEVLVESGPLLADADGRPGTEADLRSIRAHLRMTPVDRRDSASTRDSVLAVAIECDETSPLRDPELTYHWKKDDIYVAWDIRRFRLPGLRAGQQIRTITVERPLDPSIEIEVAAVVSEVGYATLF